MMPIIDSSSAVKKSWTLLYGPTKGGKTYAAAKLSQYFVDKGPAKLTDMLWIQFDQSGMGTLDERLLTVPMIDMRTKTSEKDIVLGAQQAVKDAVEAVNAGV